MSETRILDVRKLETEILPLLGKSSPEISGGGFMPQASLWEVGLTSSSSSLPNTVAKSV